MQWVKIMTNTRPISKRATSHEIWLRWVFFVPWFRNFSILEVLYFFVADLTFFGVIEKLHWMISNFYHQCWHNDQPLEKSYEFLQIYICIVCQMFLLMLMSFIIAWQERRYSFCSFHLLFYSCSLLWKARTLWQPPEGLNVKNCLKKVNHAAIRWSKEAIMTVAILMQRLTLPAVSVCRTCNNTDTASFSGLFSVLCTPFKPKPKQISRYFFFS